MSAIGFSSRKKRPQKLPWKRGPAAWGIARRADEILENLSQNPRQFISLRQAAKILGVSTQPLHDWNKRHFVQRDGPRLQFEKRELCLFVKWLAKGAKPYPSDGYLERFRRRKMPPRAFEKLFSARFDWPAGRKSLTPKELAQLIACHPSLIIKAINSDYIRGGRRTRCRWEISKSAWKNAFHFALD